MNPIKALPLCYYPTTLILVDDNKNFLKRLSTYLRLNRRLFCVSYDDPKAALQFLKKDYHENSFLQHCLFADEDAKRDHIVVDLNLQSLKNIVFHPDRFSEISLIVSDYAMPELDGLALLTQFASPLFKRMLLTGEADEYLATQAFNEGIIDRFLRKNAPQFEEAIQEQVVALQEQYFCDLSHSLLRKFSLEKDTALTILSDQKFISFFKELCLQHHIVEYYLLDARGSFLLLDAKGELSCLAVTNEEYMKTYETFAEHDEAGRAICEPIKNREQMPFFLSEEDFEVRPAEWKPYLHPARLLEGEEKYYYAYIRDLNTYNFPRETVVSYNQFLTSRGC